MPRSMLVACFLWLLSACATEPRPVELRVMTYNIHHGESSEGRLDLEGIAAVIRAQRVDVVGLQEVDRHWSTRSAFADQAAELARLLGMDGYFVPIYDLPATTPGGQRRQYGLAILSRYPIVDRRDLQLTRHSTLPGDSIPRLFPGFPAAAIDVDGVTLHLFNTHLDFRPDPAVRRVQVAETVRRMEPLPGPSVLLGDFNALPDAPELAPLYARLRDVWALRGTGPGATYPAVAPTKRIDGILVSPGIEVLSATVPETTASDHRPVVAELRLPRSR